MIILMLLFKKKWRIQISISYLTSVHDYIDASIQKKWRIQISISYLTSVHDYIDASIKEGMKDSN